MRSGPIVVLIVCLCAAAVAAPAARAEAIPSGSGLAASRTEGPAADGCQMGITDAGVTDAMRPGPASGLARDPASDPAPGVGILTLAGIALIGLGLAGTRVPGRLYEAVSTWLRPRRRLFGTQPHAA
jgi:hypothetical protein